MKRFLTITIASYAFLGNIALAGMGAFPSALAVEVAPHETANMTPVSPEDLAMTPLSPSVEEQKTQAILACKAQEEKRAVQLPGTREACPTDRCIVSFDDQAKGEHVALLAKGQEVTPTIAIVERATPEEIFASVGNRTSEREGRNLVATITSSVIFRE